MISKYFIEFILFIVGQLLSIIVSIFPEWDQMSTFNSAVSNLMSVTSQVPNFFYFMMGEFYYPAVVMVTWLLPFKFIVVPILGFLRKIIVRG